MERDGDRCVVEYFDAPTSEPARYEYRPDQLQLATLSGQTRVYHLNEAAGWEIGRVLDDHGETLLVQFPNGAARHLPVQKVFVRWDRPIEDPTPFLASRINESPRFSDGRHCYVRSQMQQRAATFGLSALLACAIELEAHQIEVVRRVLQDPIQRYLLADEVGLGKTIEAGVLIRQCLLDLGDSVTILVLAPGALVSQWRSELANRFFLGPYLDKAVHVVGLRAEADADLMRRLADADMLVIDEAHHLTSAPNALARPIYDVIAQAAPSIERVLLLSATPALHNERGFLEMLHLLDPETYPLTDEAAFREKIARRQAVAEIVAALTPENVLLLDATLDQLAELFPDDVLLQEYVATLRAMLDALPAEDDPELVEAIGAIHAHLSEVYRLHRRILRHRRSTVRGLTPDRAGVQVTSYASEDAGVLASAIDDWRNAEATALDRAPREGGLSNAGEAFWRLLGRASQFPASQAPSSCAEDATDHVAAPEAYQQAERCLARPGLFADRLEALRRALPEVLRGRSQAVVFCSDIGTADALAVALPQDGAPVYRHHPTQEEWRGFSQETGAAILVCDHRAEEGLNLQGGRKVVVHFDLPLNPNRIEQRLGRTDRYGAGEAVQSLVLLCRDDHVGQAWFAYLDQGLKVFDRSIASLQYLIEDTMRALPGAIFADGIDALADLTERSTGPAGVIERELRALNQQDALDSLGVPPSDFLDQLSDVDDDWRTIEADTAAWVETMLQFDRIEEAAVAESGPARPFRYAYATSGHHTQIPLTAFIAHCRAAIDLSPAPNRNRFVRTLPQTYSRRAALGRNARQGCVGLLRYGNPFISGITAVTAADDRGRSHATWRHEAGYRADLHADVFFRFDFVVETDVDPALVVLAEDGLTGSAAVAALRRRGDMALPPFFKSIWIDSELGAVEDPTLLAVLGRSYRPGEKGGEAGDLNLNPKRWRRLASLDLPVLDYWAELCGKARIAAEEALRRVTDLAATLENADRRIAAVDRGRLGQLRARARRRGEDGHDDRDLRLEEELSLALRAGARAPSIRVDSVGAIFLSGDRRAFDIVEGAP